MVWVLGLGPFFDLLVIGVIAGLAGTLAMSALEYPVYRARGIRGVPDYELNLLVTKRILGEGRGGRLPVAILSHFVDGALVGVGFLLVKPAFGTLQFPFPGLLFGILLFALSILLYRILVKGWLGAARGSRGALLLHFATHIIYGLVVASLGQLWA